MNGRIYDLIADLVAHLDHPWTIDKMAQKTGLSTSHFPTVFKTNLGMSPTAYLKKRRLEKAKHLLETTHEHIGQVGISVGMQNAGHFSRDFRLMCGLTPTEYRREFNNNHQVRGPDGQNSSIW